jgi:uncharacterized protein YukE
VQSTRAELQQQHTTALQHIHAQTQALQHSFDTAQRDFQEQSIAQQKDLHIAVEELQEKLKEIATTIGQQHTEVARQIETIAVLKHQLQLLQRPWWKRFLSVPTSDTHHSNCINAALPVSVATNSITAEREQKIPHSP